MLSTEFFFFGSQPDYYLILYYKAKSQFASSWLQLAPPANILMDLVDSFQLQIFRVTSLSTADVPGISQFPAGTSLNLASSTFDWSHISTFPAIMLQRPVLQSQMLLQMMGISRSCCAVSLFLIQCTR